MDGPSKVKGQDEGDIGCRSCECSTTEQCVFKYYPNNVSLALKIPLDLTMMLCNKI